MPLPTIEAPGNSRPAQNYRTASLTGCTLRVTPPSRSDENPFGEPLFNRDRGEILRCEGCGMATLPTNGSEYIYTASSHLYPEQAKNPTIIQAHLKKLFQGIHGVEFNEGETQITAMLSSAGEKVRGYVCVCVCFFLLHHTFTQGARRTSCQSSDPWSDPEKGFPP